MLSRIEDWAIKPEFWLAIITGLTVSIGLAPGLYKLYFERVGSPHPTMTHTGPLSVTSFGYQLCSANLALLCVFPIITILLTANHHKTRSINFSRLWFLLAFVQFIWGLMNMVIILGLLDL